MNVTKWYPGSIKPVHHGVYERRFRLAFSYWNGIMWRRSANTVEEAIETRGIQISNFQNLAWRGISEKTY